MCSARTYWSNWEIETVQLICSEGDAGVDLQVLHNSNPLPLNRGWITFNSALNTLKDKMAKAGLRLFFEDGRAKLGPADTEPPTT